MFKVSFLVWVLQHCFCFWTIHFYFYFWQYHIVWKPFDAFCSCEATTIGLLMGNRGVNIRTRLTATSCKTVIYSGVHSIILFIELSFHFSEALSYVYFTALSCPTPRTPSSLIWVPQSRLAFGHHRRLGWPSGLWPLAITILQCNGQPCLPLAATIGPAGPPSILEGFSSWQTRSSEWKKKDWRHQWTALHCSVRWYLTTST